MRCLHIALVVLAGLLVTTSEAKPLLGGLLGGGGGGGGGGLLGGLLGGGGGGLLGGLLGGGGGGLLGGLLGGEGGLLDLFGEDGLLSILDQVWCLVRDLGLQAVLQLLDQLGLSDLLKLKEIVCGDGTLLMESGESVNAGLLGILGGDGLLNLDLLNQLLCLIQSLGLDAVIQLLDQLGLDELLKLDEVICPNGEPLIDGVDLGDGMGGGMGRGGDRAAKQGILYVLLDAMGLSECIKLINQLGLQGLLELGSVLVVNGQINLDLLDQILCLVRQLGLDPVLELLDNLGLAYCLKMYEIICPDGIALMANFDVNVELLIRINEECGDATDDDCASFVSGLFATETCEDICALCDLIANDMGIMECNSGCDSNCS